MLVSSSSCARRETPARRRRVSPGAARAVGPIVRDLRGTAAASQARVRAELDRLGVRYRPYWIVNAFAVEGGRAAVEALARLPEVASIETDRGFDAQTAATVVAAPARRAAPTGVEWNIARVGAPQLWAIGVTGQGIVYANADSGVTWNHPALKPHYRGWDGTTVTHDYNWWDAVHADIDGNGTNPCGFNSQAPCDDDTANSHGTHTMGTAVGDDGAGNQIGVAPGAKWIACHNQDQGTGRPSSYIECFQFFLAPTDLQGHNPNPDRRPNVVGNSYACPPNELCSEDVLQPAMDAMRAAGIFMSVSAGNEGPSCSTVAEPPAPYDSSVSVGATDGLDVIARFSSRGPVTADGSGRMKPDLVAPGVSVRSSEAGGYGVLSGTSMASPHVGGAVALLWSAFPNLRGNVDATERLLEETARPLTSAQGCGGDSVDRGAEQRLRLRPPRRVRRVPAGRNGLAAGARDRERAGRGRNGSRDAGHVRRHARAAEHPDGDGRVLDAERNGEGSVRLSRCERDALVRARRALEVGHGHGDRRRRPRGRRVVRARAVVAVERVACQCDGDRDDHERRRRRPDRAPDHAASRQRARAELHALGAGGDDGAGATRSPRRVDARAVVRGRFALAAASGARPCAVRRRGHRARPGGQRRTRVARVSRREALADALLVEPVRRADGARRPGSDGGGRHRGTGIGHAGDRRRWGRGRRAASCSWWARRAGRCP